MLDFKKVIFLCSVVVFAESAFVDTLGKCSINDGECLRKLYESIMRDIGKSGIKELGIPPIDPIELKNIDISVMDLLTVRMVDGVATGAKDCIFNSFETDIENDHASMDITCDINIKGRYKIFSSPIFTSLFGQNSIHADGFVKVKLEKLRIKFDYDFYVIKGDDNELYFKCKNKNNATQYEYDLLGQSRFYLDHLYLGDTDMSEFVTSFLNSNGNWIMKSFGGSFMDKAMEFFYIFTHRFFDAVPTRYYIIEDLTSYVKE